MRIGKIFLVCLQITYLKADARVFKIYEKAQNACKHNSFHRSIMFKFYQQWFVINLDIAECQHFKNHNN